MSGKTQNMKLEKIQRKNEYLIFFFKSFIVKRKYESNINLEVDLS